MENNFAFVSIIIPCRNEEKFIGKCLDSIITQDFSKKKLEVLVVDGMSEDRSREIIEKYSRNYIYIKLLENRKKYTPFALNIGVREAKGEIIMKMDAHATYAKDYISKCMSYLKKYNADNVGGVIKIVPKENTLIAKAITLVLSHPFGAGNSYFRTGFRRGVKGPQWVDTVFGGCYKKEVFKTIGLFNENLTRSQDIEFNLRLKKAGGKILLVPEISANYYPASNLSKFFRHNLLDGIWVIYPLKFVRMPFSFRHYIILLFVLSLLGSLILSFFFSIFWWFFILEVAFYFLASFYFAFKTVIREKKLIYLFILPPTFAIRHFGYGLGSLWGLGKVLVSKIAKK